MDSNLFRRGKVYCKHPLEDCVVRTVPIGQFAYETYLMFPGGEEYKPVQHSNIVLQVILSSELEFITEEEYFAFGKKKEPQKFQSEKPERIGGIQSLIVDLALGRKEPSNEKERKILKEIKEIEAKGGMLDLPLE